MANMRATRRRFLASSLVFSGIATGTISSSLFNPAAALAAAAGRNSGRDSLAHIARRTYPHDALDDSVYRAIVDGILDAASSDPGLAKSLDALIAGLDRAHGDDWVAADPAEQLALLSGVQAEPYFAAARIQVLTRLYNHPATWKAIGYEGPSVPFGGYVERGFDNIDWLPEDAS